jgi:hypothetical protein
MAYTINLTNGTTFATIADGTINTTSSMVLVGKNYAGYGEFLDENFIHLLESGANTSAPSAPLTGQLWWDTTNAVMKVYNGTIFKVISASTASASQPTNNVAGDLWFDTTNQQLKVYNGSAFILVGPASSSGQGTSGAIVTTVADNTAVDHVIIQFYVKDSIVAIMSKDSTFTPNPAITGFSTIGPGMQLSSSVSSVLFRGTATDSQLLDSLDSTQFLRSDANDTTSGTLGVLNDTGLTVGADQDAKISVNTATSEVQISNVTQDANVAIRVNDGGVTNNAIFINGSTTEVSIPNALNLNVNAAASAIVNSAGNGVGNIGSASSYFNTVFATSTSAQYADVAERFASDDVYEPGTVVMLGGEKEITECAIELSEKVFGVISTSAAYLMNAGAGDDNTHPPVAMTGRVPVKVAGSINKGDRLVPAGDGLARAARKNEAKAFNVIGRALESKSSNNIGLVEAIVTIN